MLRFEADPGQGGPPEPTPAPGPAPEPYPEPEPAPEPAPEPTPAPPAGLSWDSPELLDLVDARAQQIAEAQLGQLAPILEQLAAAGDPAATAAAAAPGVGPTLDPLSDTFGQDLQQLLATEREQTLAAIQGMFATVTQPMEAAQKAAELARGEDNLSGMLDDNIGRYGDFPADPETGRSAKELVRPLADSLFPRIAERLGHTPRAAELAIEQAAQMVRDMGGVYARQGVNRETTRLTAIAGARGEPGAAGAGGVPTRPEPRSPSEVTARYAAEAKRLWSEGHV